MQLVVDNLAKSFGVKTIFKNVSFMDSSGIGLVMGRYRLLQSINPACQIEIKNVTLQTKKIMELAGLSSIAKIKENENEYKKAN